MRTSPHNAVNLLMDPLFVDALSGEFRASVDPERLHTVGRLVVATFQKGKAETNDTTDKDGPNPALTHLITYSPSWEKSVQVTVLAKEMDTYSNITSVGLTRGGSIADALSIGTVYKDRDPVSYLSVSLPGTLDAKHFPLELGDGINNARQAVQDAAHAFFE